MLNGSKATNKETLIQRLNPVEFTKELDPSDHMPSVVAAADLGINITRLNSLGAVYITPALKF